ncbi:MAG TPA: pyruvate kinase [Spirochaetota bacterium]|nr:pyruvate kinase [Spirochaetota bacterium]
MLNIRKTKIFATMGPASANEKVLQHFIQNGVNAVRLNFSHGSHDEYTRTIKLIRRIKPDMPVMADLKGAEIRTVVQNANGIKLEAGRKVELVFDNSKITADNFSLNYKDIAAISRRGNHILIDDGNIDLKIESVGKDRLILIPQQNYTLLDKKGTHFTGIDVPFPLITERDKQDIAYAEAQKVDYLAASMIKSEKELRAIKSLISGNIKLVAKIEHPLALKNIEAIMDSADMILVARGDLGVEMPVTEVPTIQKTLIARARAKAKPVIIATQLLDSMMHNSRPTRAEVNDIANGIYDKVDALMLTGETAAGQYPQEAVSYLNETIVKTEAKLDYYTAPALESKNKKNSADAISLAAVDTAYALKVKALLCFTTSGSTALRIARFRPSMPIRTFTPAAETARQLAAVFGICALKTPYFKNTDEMISHAQKVLLEKKIAAGGDSFVMTAGIPLAQSGPTNMIRVLEFN